MTCMLEKRKPYFNDVSDYKQTLNMIKNSPWFIPNQNAKNKNYRTRLTLQGQILLEDC